MMLRYSLDVTEAADALDAGLKAIMAAGAATADIGGNDSTRILVGERFAQNVRQFTHGPGAPDDRG